MSLRERIATWGSLVTFSHSVFALPFALIMVVLVAKERHVSVSQVSLLIACVVAARTAAMAFNRFIDAEIDARNPRTTNREIPSGVITKSGAALLTTLASAAFIGGAGALGWHCLVLSPLVLVVLLGYSFMKRVSSWCHVVLGIALALAPGGVWYALTGEWSWKPVPLMVCVVFWVAGFDILYSCQDAEFDRSQKLLSVPSRLGVERAKIISAALHVFAVASLAVNGTVFPVGYTYWLGVLVFAAFLTSQHLVVRQRGLGTINRVFFTRNGAASVVLFASVLADAIIT